MRRGSMWWWGRKNNAVHVGHIQSEL